MTTHPMVAEIGHWARCANCNEPIHEDWDPSARRCAKCALDNDCWDRDSRMERYRVPPRGVMMVPSRSGRDGSRSSDG